MEKEYTVQQAIENAREWCKDHPGWKAICDIDNTDALYKTWDELPRQVKAPWIHTYRKSAADAWSEFGRRPCKVPFGFITGAGEFYYDVLDVPRFHNYCMVFEIGGEAQ